MRQIVENMKDDFTKTIDQHKALKILINFREKNYLPKDVKILKTIGSKVKDDILLRKSH